MKSNKGAVCSIKSSHDDTFSTFQAIDIELSKQPKKKKKKKKKEHLGFVISFIRVSAVSNGLEQLAAVLLGSFLKKNCKHLSHPILVLLF